MAVRARAVGRTEPTAQLQFLARDDPRIRLVDLTAPSDGTLLICLQSLADSAVICRLTTPFPFTQAFRSACLCLAPQQPGVVTAGALPSSGVNFIVLATGTVLLLALLDFLPALALGPLAEGFKCPCAVL
ncbi:potassium-transporting ATPase subunit KdpA [Streptomyces shenzhenensis]|uniref:potassium-transporting ATPase subunit KdpA n=1 Tax=Streptomyces shenzhenensis TaxID=943815 RepID=UPI00217D806B|nr:potassium-transporting ATPase subunit KdpA [Streptomyces shenzhenensis]